MVPYYIGLSIWMVMIPEVVVVRWQWRKVYRGHAWESEIALVDLVHA
jgi:hypothetical protein